MENHPIPQDVTGFQFKLIGDMTVKQFAYLAGGAILAWIFFILPFPIFIRLPLSLACASLGAALAFLPVGGRPLDTMLLRFIEAVFSPNQYLYNKQGGRLLVNHIQLHAPTNMQTAKPQVAQQPEDKLARFLQTLPQKPKTPLDQKENDRFDKVLSSIGRAEVQVQTHSQPTPQIFANPGPYLVSTQPSIRKEDMINKPIHADKNTEPAPVQQPTSPMEEQKSQTLPSLSLQKQLGDLLAQKKELNGNTPVYSTAPQVMVQTPQAPTVQKQPVRTTTPFAPEAPNVIAGTIKDPRGNVLPNVLVEVKDKEGNPVRAFKTNSLGQFASATPLLNGTYTIEFEDTSNTHRFNALEVQVAGSLIPTLEIISTDEREDLRKSLFESV